MTDKEKLLKLRKLADAMYYAAQHLTTDASRLHKAMDEYHQFIINEYHKKEPTIPDIVDEHFYEMLEEEPVSEDLEEEIQKTIYNHFFDLDGIAIVGASVYATVGDMVYIAKHFAQWQKEQMMKNAIDCYIRRNKCTKKNVLNGFDVTCDAIQKFNGGDKVKVIVIEED